MAAIALKPRVNEDLTSRYTPPCPTISFKHPAYTDSDDILFKLPRLDYTEDGAIAGIHHRTALQACQIVANNAFHGYLATDRDGQNAVSVAPDELLTESQYWFVVNRRDGDGDVEQIEGHNVYPVVPSFDDWAFPHREFPLLGWDLRPSSPQLYPPGPISSTSPSTSTTASSNAPPIAPPTAPHPIAAPPPIVPPSTAPASITAVPTSARQTNSPAANSASAQEAPVSATSEASIAPTTFAVPALPRSSPPRCVLSNHAYSISKAHLIPSANIEWFRINNMKQYEDEQQSQRFINNTNNIVPIRYDLHTAWDAHAFAFLPKQNQFVAHILAVRTQSSREFAADWHNRLVQKNAFESVAKQYMFAKFAQAIFMLLKPFIAYSPVGRYVARLRGTAGNMDKHSVQKEWLTGKTLEDLYSDGGSRRASASSSSRKRSRSQASANEEEWTQQKSFCVMLWPDSGALDDEHCENSWFREETFWPEEERGRPRKRRQRYSRSEYTVDTLPSLTDTSAVDEEEYSYGAWLDSEVAKLQPDPVKPSDRHSVWPDKISENSADGQRAV